MRMSQSGERIGISRERANPVRVALFDETDFVHEGQMDFVDNAMDQLTGTICGHKLCCKILTGDAGPGPVRPHSSARQRRAEAMIFVPDAAIVAGPTTRLVFVVGNNDGINRASEAGGAGTAAKRPVTASSRVSTDRKRSLSAAYSGGTRDEHREAAPR